MNKSGPKSGPKSLPPHPSAPSLSQDVTVHEIIPGSPFRKGYDPRRGLGPARGAPNADRPRNWFVEECHRLSDEEVLPKVEAVLQDGDPNDPTFRWAAEYVARFSKVPKGVHSETAPVATMPPEEMERTLNAALRDPAVREWLVRERPDALQALRAELPRLAPPS